MNVLGLDYGEARTGAAWASSEVRLALPLDVLASQDTKSLITEISQIIEEKEIELILVGLPLNLSSEDSQQTQKVRSFVDSLTEQVDVEVQLVDERFTSQLASQYLEKGQSIDVESARILVEEWLETLPI